MKNVLESRKSIIRALAAGHIIVCNETGEAWECQNGSSLNNAKRFARLILNDEARKTFYIWKEERA